MVFSNGPLPSIFATDHLVEKAHSWTRNWFCKRIPPLMLQPVCILTSRRQKFLWRKQVSTHVSTLAPPTSRNISFLQRRDALRAKSRSYASFEGVHSSSVPAFSDIHVVLNSVPHIIFQAAAPKLGQWRPSIEYQSSSTLSSTVLADFKIAQKMPHRISCVHYSGSKT